MGSFHECRDEGTVQTMDSLFKQWIHCSNSGFTFNLPTSPGYIQTSTFKSKNDGYSILGSQRNFVDGINDAWDHNNVRDILISAE